MRILITEEALRLGNGHWPRYVQDLAEGFRAAGDHVDVLAHKDATQKVFDAVPGALPWFERDCRGDKRSQGLIGGIRHNFAFYRDLNRWLASHEVYDWVLSLSSRPKHLLAFALLARQPRLVRTRFLVLMVLGFGKVAAHKPLGGRAEFRPGAANLFAKLCFFLLRGAVRREQVVLAAETKGMQGELQRFSGLPASLYPHPVELRAQGKKTEKLKIGNAESEGDRREEMGDGDGKAERLKSGKAEREADGGYSGKVERCEGGKVSGEEGEKAEKLKIGNAESEGDGRVELEDSNGEAEKLKSGKAEKLKGEVRVIAPGFARHEKGSDLLQGAIKLMGAKAGGAKFVLQWQEDFPLPDGTMVLPDSGLQAGGVVDYLSAILTGEDYLEFLRSGDLVVLPYRSGSYNRRVSRVSVEAALMGKPIVYTRDTWSAEVAAMAGGGVEIPEETPAAIAAAIEQGLADLTHLQQRAQRGAKAVRDYYSVAQFRELLLQEKRNTK